MNKGLIILFFLIVFVASYSLLDVEGLEDRDSILSSENLDDIENALNEEMTLCQRKNIKVYRCVKRCTRKGCKSVCGYHDSVWCP
jgi:hypothetical protein